MCIKKFNQEIVLTFEDIRFEASSSQPPVNHAVGLYILQRLQSQLIGREIRYEISTHFCWYQERQYS